MFFSKLMFSKRGSLAKVWLAAHHQDKKVSKNTIVSTNLEDSVHDIISPTAPLALRLSGQLLLGVVRIYQRKARYLQEDCTDALTKIRMSFRPGAVDLPPDANTASLPTITLQANNPDIDLLDELEFTIPDVPLSRLVHINNDIDEVAVDHSNIARAADITLDNYIEHGFPDILTSQASAAFGDVELELGEDEALINLEPFDDGVPMELPENSFTKDSFEEVEVGRDAGIEAINMSEMMDLGESVNFELQPKEREESDLGIAQRVELATSSSDLAGALEVSELHAAGDFNFNTSGMLYNESMADAVDIQLKRSRKRAREKLEQMTELTPKQIAAQMKDKSGFTHTRSQLVFTSNAKFIGEELLSSLSRSSRLVAPQLADMLANPKKRRSNVPSPIEDSHLVTFDEHVSEPELHASFDSRIGHEFGGPRIDDMLDQSMYSEIPFIPENEVAAEKEIQEEQVVSTSNELDAEDGNAADGQEEQEVERGGWSVRTKKMYHLLANRLASTSSVGLAGMIEGKNRRTAASVFHELLVLKSHDYITVSQDEPYQDVTIRKTSHFGEPLPALA